jgi:hypothetical protein
MGHDEITGDAEFAPFLVVMRNSTYNRIIKLSHQSNQSIIISVKLNISQYLSKCVKMHQPL